MYSKSKYIVGEINGEVMSTFAALVFSEHIGHNEVARLFVPGTITGAGFCHYKQDKVEVYGESISLKVKCNPEVDERLVGRAMSHPAYVI